MSNQKVSIFRKKWCCNKVLEIESFFRIKRSTTDQFLISLTKNLAMQTNLSKFVVNCFLKQKISVNQEVVMRKESMTEDKNAEAKRVRCP